MRLFYFFAALLAFCQTALGNHLSNATIRYDYIGTWTTDSNAYLVTVVSYNNCNYLEGTVDVKIYDNLYHGPLLQTVKLPLVARSWADPLVSANASVAFCIVKNTYIDTVYLPKSSAGYILYYADYFLSYQTPYVFSVLIPADGAPVNTMPIDACPPSYFIPINESVVFDVSLKDADGDSLSYAYASIYYKDDHGQPLSYLDSSKNFNDAGKSNGQSLNPVTGIFTLRATTPGTFVLAIEATEFRKGVEIGRYRYYVNIGAVVKDLHQNPQIDLYGTKNKNSISLSWENSLGLVHQFYIQRKIGNSDWVIIDSTGTKLYGGDKTIFADSIERSYRIKAGGYIGSWFTLVVSNQWKTGGSKTTAVTAPTTEDGIKLYPNPATDKLFLELPENYRPENIIISDVLGRLVMAINPAHVTEQLTINIEALPRGVYILSVINNQNILTTKFYKQ